MLKDLAALVAIGMAVLVVALALPNQRHESIGAATGRQIAIEADAADFKYQR